VEFQVGDKLVYPSQGVSVVERVGDEELAGQVFRCYHLRLLGSNSKVMVPVGNSERVGLRPLAGQDEVEAALERLRGSGGDDEHDWKDRYKANLDRIKTGDLQEVVDVLLCLADVASRKTLSFRERKMFDHAQQLLVYEVAEVEGRSVDEVEQEVAEIVQERVGSVLEEDEE